MAMKSKQAACRFVRRLPGGRMRSIAPVRAFAYNSAQATGPGAHPPGTVEEREPMAARAPICEFGWKAVDFSLPGTDGKTWTLRDGAGPRGTVVAFICNHCPYVKAVADRLGADARALDALGVGFLAINANDADAYPADSFDNMVAFARAHAFGFPYLWDETQAVARAYGAVCTPDFFGFNADFELQYRGRLDAAGIKPAGPDTRRDLVEAMRQVAETGRGPADQIASMGCSIKWRPAA